MTSKWKVIVLVGVLVVFFLALASREPRKAGQPGEQPGEVAAPAPTGNIDDVLAALLQDAAGEQVALQDQDEIATLAGTDNEEIANFGQSINE